MTPKDRFCYTVCPISSVGFSIYRFFTIFQCADIADIDITKNIDIPTFFDMCFFLRYFLYISTKITIYRHNIWHCAYYSLHHARINCATKSQTRCLTAGVQLIYIFMRVNARGASRTIPKTNTRYDSTIALHISA